MSNQTPNLYTETYGIIEDMLSALPELQPHDPAHYPEDSEQSLGAMTETFETCTEEYREYLALNDDEAAITDLMTHALHWAHSKELDVPRILRGAISHFIHENNGH